MDGDHLIANRDPAEMSLGQLRETLTAARRITGKDSALSRLLKVILDLRAQLRKQRHSLPGMLTPEEFAAYLHIPKSTLRHWVIDGRVPPPVKITAISGKRFLVRDIVAWEAIGCPNWADFQREQSTRLKVHGV